MVLILNTLFKPERSFLSSSMDPFDWQSNIVFHWCAIAFQAFCISCIAMLIMSVDMWRVAACFMFSGFLDVLCSRMQRLGWSNASIREQSALVMVDSEFLHTHNAKILATTLDRTPVHEKDVIDCVEYHILCMRYLYTDQIRRFDGFPYRFKIISSL